MRKSEAKALEKGDLVEVRLCTAPGRCAWRKGRLAKKADDAGYEVFLDVNVGGRVRRNLERHEVRRAR